LRGADPAKPAKNTQKARICGVFTEYLRFAEVPPGEALKDLGGSALIDHVL